MWDGMSESGDLNKLKVLYVEDEAIIRITLAKLLLRRNAEVVQAKNGQQGLELYREVRPDVIITDLQMPIMNGQEMIRQIRQLDSSIPIVVTSAYSCDKDEYNITAVLDKPVNISTLQSVLQCYVPQ